MPTQKIPIRHIETPEKEPVLSGTFSVRTIRDLLSERDMVQELHRHDFFFILVLDKGIGTHAIDFTSYEVGDRSVFMMRPGQVHQLTLKTGSSGFLIQFKSDFYFTQDQAKNQLLRKASSRNLYQFDSDTFDKVCYILTSIFREFNDQQDGYPDVIKANLGILFIELVRQQRNNTFHSVNLYAQQRLDEFLQLLEMNITTHKGVADYADQLNITAYQLNRLTKAAFGKTGSELINEHLILESKRLLLATADQVNQIAYHLGYEDVSYFIRFFKKHTGYSPEAFRNKFV